MKELIQIADCLATLRSGETAALATVVAVEGSAYRRPGARMLMTREGRSAGIVSGGCVDYDVFEHARRVMANGVPTMLRYDSSKADDLVFGTGLGCKGVVDVLVEPVQQRLADGFQQFVRKVREEREPGMAVAHLPDENRGGHQQFFVADRPVMPGNGCGADLRALAAEIPVSSRAALVTAREGARSFRAFVEFVEPPLHLVLFGGWFDLLPLVRFARELGWMVTIVDVRQRGASRETFREADAVLLATPEEALQRIRFDQRTAVVLMNHHFEHDSACLHAVSGAPLRYLGLLGPRRRRALLLERMHAAGLPEWPETVLHGPVGLDIGSETPDEIALAIAAEIKSVFA